MYVKEFIVYDVLTLALGEQSPGSSEENTRYILEQIAGRKLERFEWVPVAIKARELILGTFPDMRGVPMPDKEDASLVSEWKRAVHVHFGLIVDVPLPGMKALMGMKKERTGVTTWN